MGWSGGTYTRTNGSYTGANVWATDESNGFDIESARHDTHDKDLADGINACLTKDVTNEPSAHVDWLRKVWWGGTAGGSGNAFTLTLTPAPTAYYAGMRIAFIGVAANTGATTVNVNGLGVRSVEDAVSDPLTAGTVKLGGMHEIIYTGSEFRLVF